MKIFNQFINKSKIDEFYDPSKKSGGGGEPKNFKTEGNHHNLQWNLNINRYEPETRK